MSLAGGGERDLPSLNDLRRLAVVNAGRRKKFDARVAVLSLYQVKNVWQKARLSRMQPKRAGKSGRYFSVRKWLSE